jgi:hypothetical protein
MLAWIKYGSATLWLAFGLVFKILGLVPRHRDIVARVVGDGVAAPVTLAVGAAEVGLALWILSGVRPRWCAAAQTLAIGTMNVIELRVARDLLLAPVAMVLANLVFLSLVWYWAVRTESRPQQP